LGGYRLAAWVALPPAVNGDGGSAWSGGFWVSKPLPFREFRRIAPVQAGCWSWGRIVKCHLPHRLRQRHPGRQAIG